jgi:hypothetical protein
MPRYGDSALNIEMVDAQHCRVGDAVRLVGMTTGRGGMSNDASNGLSLSLIECTVPVIPSEKVRHSRSWVSLPEGGGTPRADSPAKANIRHFPK